VTIGLDYTTAYRVGDPPRFGLSNRELRKHAETVAWTPARQPLARGDTAPSFYEKLMKC
jgi:hypothetical protein